MLRGQCGTTGFGILMYHRVCPTVPGLQAPTWNVTPANLEAQLQHLLLRGFEPWRLVDIVTRIRRGIAIPRKAFVVTFDDGYECVASQAYPILEKLDVPATVFIATGLVGRNGRMPQDDWSEAGDERVPAECYQAMALETCDRMHESTLIDLGSHTHTHQDFRQRPKEFAEDIQKSANFMKTRWGLRNVPFAFPYGCSQKGFCTSAMKAAVKDAGFSCAVTADAQIVDPRKDNIFGWGRIIATNQDSGRMLAAKLDNWYGALKHVGLRFLPTVCT